MTPPRKKQEFFATGVIHSGTNSSRTIYRNRFLTAARLIILMAATANIISSLRSSFFLSSSIAISPEPSPWLFALPSSARKNDESSSPGGVMGKPSRKCPSSRRTALPSPRKNKNPSTEALWNLIMKDVGPSSTIPLPQCELETTHRAAETTTNMPSFGERGRRVGELFWQWAEKHKDGRILYVGDSTTAQFPWQLLCGIKAYRPEEEIVRLDPLSFQNVQDGDTMEQVATDRRVLEYSEKGPSMSSVQIPSLNITISAVLFYRLYPFQFEQSSYTMRKPVLDLLLHAGYDAIVFSMGNHYKLEKKDAFAKCLDIVFEAFSQVEEGMTESVFVHEVFPQHFSTPDGQHDANKQQRGACQNPDPEIYFRNGNWRNELLAERVANSDRITLVPTVNMTLNWAHLKKGAGGDCTHWKFLPYPAYSLAKAFADAAAATDFSAVPC